MKRAIIVNILMGIAILALCGQVAMADLYVLGKVFTTGEFRTWQFDNAGMYVRDFGLVTDPCGVTGAIGVTPGGSVILMYGHTITEYTASGVFVRTVATGVLSDFTQGVWLGHVDESAGIYVNAGSDDPSGRIEKYGLDGSLQAVYNGHSRSEGIFADAQGSVYAVGYTGAPSVTFTRWSAGGGEPEVSQELSHKVYTADINCDDEEFYCVWGGSSASTIYVDDLDGAALRTIPVTLSPYAYWVDYDPVRRHLFVANTPAPGMIQELALDGTPLDTYDMGDYGLITIRGMATTIPEPVTITLAGIGAAAILLRRRKVRCGRTSAAGLLAVLLAILWVPTVVQATITYTVTPAGSYVVNVGSTTTLVDTYTITYDSGPEWALGAFVVDVGLYAGKGGYDPFQGARVLDTGKGYKTRLTPTQETADLYLGPPDGTNVYEADSHFLPAGIGTWPVAVVTPYETNDKGIYNPGNVDGDYALGTGLLTVAVAIPVDLRTHVMDVMRVGVVHGTYVWLHDQSADELGHVTREYILIPEPATLALLAAGVGLWLGRRRRPGLG